MPRNIKAFVIMPFGNGNEYREGQKESDHVFDSIIKPAVSDAMFVLGQDVVIDVHREVDRNTSGSITAAIVYSLVESDIVIADLTGHNANVFFELGIRSSLRRKVTILLAQKGTVLPFDIKDYRCVEYDSFQTHSAQEKLKKFIVAGITGNGRPDSLVFDTFPSLVVRIPGMIEAVGDAVAANREMSWDDYFGKIQWFGDLLKDALNDGSFAPDVVVGISNGGLVVADLLGRNHLRGTPVVSLWASRFKRDNPHAFWYFKNRYNDSLMAAVGREVQQQRGDDPPSVLLVDDRVGTGLTALQAIDYLRDVLGQKTKIVFLPLVVSRPEYVDTIKPYLPCNCVDVAGRPLSRMPEAEFIAKLLTPANRFPYKKAITEDIAEVLA